MRTLSWILSSFSVLGSAVLRHDGAKNPEIFEITDQMVEADLLPYEDCSHCGGCRRGDR